VLWSIKSASSRTVARVCGNALHNSARTNLRVLTRLNGYPRCKWWSVFSGASSAFTECLHKRLRQGCPLRTLIARLYMVQNGIWRLALERFSLAFAKRPFLKPEGTQTVLTEVFVVSQFYRKGTRWRSWLRHCATSRKVAGSIPDGVTGIFQWLNPSCRIVALGSTQPLTQMSTSNLSWG
jgi:hypothetical protein